MPVFVEQGATVDGNCYLKMQKRRLSGDDLMDKNSQFMVYRNVKRHGDIKRLLAAVSDAWDRLRNKNHQ